MTTARLKLANLTLNRIVQPLLQLETLVASTGWHLVPEVIRTPAENSVRTLHRVEIAATAVVTNKGVGELQVADAKASSSQSYNVLVLFSCCKKTPSPKHPCKGSMFALVSTLTKSQRFRACSSVHSHKIASASLLFHSGVGQHLVRGEEDRPLGSAGLEPCLEGLKVAWVCCYLAVGVLGQAKKFGIGV